MVVEVRRRMVEGPGRPEGGDQQQQQEQQRRAGGDDGGGRERRRKRKSGECRRASRGPLKRTPSWLHSWAFKAPRSSSTSTTIS